MGTEYVILVILQYSWAVFFLIYDFIHRLQILSAIEYYPCVGTITFLYNVL